MDSGSTNSTNPRYESIPDCQHVETPPELLPASSQSQIRRLIPGLRSSFSALRSRFSRVAIVAATVLAATFVVSDRYGLIHHDRVYLPSHAFTHGGSPAEALRSPDLHVGKGIFRTASSKLRETFAHVNPFRSGSIHESSGSCEAVVEDFVKEERVPTGDCGIGLYCRARVVATKTGDEVTVEAGYMIYEAVGGPMAVDSFTGENVAKVTRQEAEGWATTLLELISEELNQVKCEVTSDMIAQAIMDTKDTVASCPNTGDARCKELLTIKNCTVAPPCGTKECSGETEKQKRCHEFLMSSTSPTTYDDLDSSPCQNMVFEQEWLGMDVPFCKQDCGEKNCSQTVYGKMMVQADFGPPDPRPCLSAAYTLAFQSVRATVPKCVDIPSTSILSVSGIDIVLVGDKWAKPVGTIPRAVEDVAKEAGCWLDAIYFVFTPSLTDYLHSACTEGS